MGVPRKEPPSIRHPFKTPGRQCIVGIWVSWGQIPQAWRRMLGVDGFLQAMQLALESSQAGVGPLKQAHCESTVEVLDSTVALRASRWNEDWRDAKATTQKGDPRKVTGHRPPSNELAGVVELALERTTKGLPALAQELQDGLHFARALDSQANSASPAPTAQQVRVEGIPADQYVVPLPVAFQVNRADTIDLVQLMGVFGLRGEIGKSG